MQKCPLPVKPGEHVQVYEPILLEQEAFKWQPLPFSVHSSLSENLNRTAIRDPFLLYQEVIKKRVNPIFTRRRSSNPKTQVTTIDFSSTSVFANKL